MARVSLSTETVAAGIAVLLVSVAITVSILFTWGATTVQNAKEDVRSATDAFGNEIRFSYVPVEQAAHALALIAEHELREQGAIDDPRRAGDVIASLDLSVQGLGETTAGASGSWLYLSPDVFGKVYYSWYDLEAGEFVRTEDTEVNDSLYLTMRDPRREDIDYSWYFSPAEAREPMWTRLYYDTDLHEMSISYAVPIIVNGTLYGVAGLDLDFTTVSEQLRTFSIGGTGQALIIDDMHQMVIAPERTPEWFPRATSLIHEEKGQFEIGGDIITYTRIASHQFLVTIVPARAVDGIIGALHARALLAFFLLTCLLIGAIIALLRRIAPRQRGPKRPPRSGPRGVRALWEALRRYACWRRRSGKSHAPDERRPNA